ncbi:class I fructose-bisphosphate aldolase [Bythopirellula goksoeyrii]|uniref:Putative aldolase LsrF n=1 Tax=Bythopirellula goksoeyrii TaxID=1400387 RepID=A0A5B9Q6V3_9BACT|nr:hypothetical protein [Bythopirellula goksoeyrii]QEG33440.1 putative aldolase LsrF [Bythopirellula goksoeyrii]
MDGREIRLQRLVGEGRAVIIAFDHGLFDGPISGLEDLTTIERKINSVVDAVLLAPGMMRRCSGVFSHPKRPLAMVRLNWNTVYCFRFGYREAKSVLMFSPEDALREGMDIALVSLTLQTGCEERDAANVEVFSKLTNDCHRLGIPVVGEYFPTGHVEMTPDQLHSDVLVGSRIVAELGADAIKTFNTCRFQEVTSSCPVPVFGLGAEKLPTQREALELAEAEVQAGAGGVVFGRNAIQVPNPQAFQAALCEVVKDSVRVNDVVNKYDLS